MAKTQKQDIGDLVVSTKEAASVIQVSSVWVGKLEQMGYVSKVARGRWRLVDVVQGYIRSLKDDERRSAKSAAATRIQDAKAEEIALRLAVQKRELIPVEQVHEVMDFISAKVRDELAGMPASFTRDMDLRRKLEDDVHDRQTRLADKFEQAARALAEGGDLFKTG